MKVLHILDSLNRGGIEMMALDVCRNAVTNNLDLTFVATGGGDLEDDFRNSGADFIRLRRRFPVDPTLIARLREIMRERKIQVVHCHQAVDALHAYFATSGTLAKRVLTFHGWLPSTKNRVAVKFLIPRMDANLAVSAEVLGQLANKEGFDTSKKFEVLYNGVDAKRLRGDGSRLRIHLGLKEHHILLGMVGNFYVGVKDQMTVCKALPQVFRQAPDAHFAFIGGRSASAPQLYDDCVDFCRQHHLADRVHFMGKRTDISDVLNALDLFIFSSLQEGSPIAVIEAMMLGLPTVVSDIRPLLEVSGDGAYALPFRARDPEDLAQQLIKLIKAPAMRSRLGAQAQQWANAQFSIESHIEKLKRLYGSLVGIP